MSYCIHPILGYTAYIQSTTNSFKVRPIRAFGNWTMGCMDETAENYMLNSNFDKVHVFILVVGIYIIIT